MKAAAPSRGASAAPERTMSAPIGPPIQFHHGAPRAATASGGVGRRMSITVAAVRIVPQIEKKAAHSGLWRWDRSDAFAEA